MTNSELIKQLSYTTALRENRMRAANYILDHPETIAEVLELCFGDYKELSYKAAWAFEFVFIEQPSLLYPHFDYFFGMLPTAKLDQVVRPMAHICERLCIANYKKLDPGVRSSLSEEHKLVMTECSFDWLITDQKVACQVRAMTCLFYLGTEIDWIHPELKQILEDNVHKGSAGYKSRAKKTLEQIRKFRYS
ncbi:adenylosuccinate lyase [Aureitalea sp. L0-47]|uniref:adenylosuccinate lyase n=1 Tax=Aureitalea sp. L0-47 TaxID=2816962 RepID=UPI002237CBE8|nr:adenylosuccinate lyase [Aureitalea sp. L0-47]MCW5521200.1 adenylosuccinate lyase [Aureitalea sp. L0-47]